MLLRHYGDDRVELGVTTYRAHYGAMGMFEAVMPIQGITEERVAALRSAGHGLFNATSKLTVFARAILERLGLADAMAGIYGSLSPAACWTAKMRSSQYGRRARASTPNGPSGSATGAKTLPARTPTRCVHRGEFCGGMAGLWNCGTPAPPCMAAEPRALASAVGALIGVATSRSAMWDTRAADERAPCRWRNRHGFSPFDPATLGALRLRSGGRDPYQRERENARSSSGSSWSAATMYSPGRSGGHARKNGTPRRSPTDRQRSNWMMGAGRSASRQ